MGLHKTIIVEAVRLPDNRKTKAEPKELTGTVVSFAEDTVYGTLAIPETGNITGNVTGARMLAQAFILHQAGTAPTFDSKFKKMSDSANYVINALNFIVCQYIGPTHINYYITTNAAV